MVIALAVIVLDVLADHPANVALPDRNDLRQALRSDRSNESLGIRIQIRATARELHGTHSRALERFSERRREERIAVVNQVSVATQEAVFAIRPVSSDLTQES